jgi:glutathione S-transferase
MPSTRTARLITIPFSHFCEKARWGADWLGVPYREDGYVPGLHAFAARRASGKRRVPVWVTPDQEAIVDSTAILQRLDAEAPLERRLYPSDPSARRDAESLEELFDTELGPATRGWAYDHALQDGSQLVALCGVSMGLLERLAFRALAPLLSTLIRRDYRIALGSAGTFLARARAVFDAVDARLAHGERYLVGGAFSVADLTFAALSTPVLLPPETPGLMTDVSKLPAEGASIIREMRDTPAGRHALRMYREHRRRGGPQPN